MSIKELVAKLLAEGYASKRVINWTEVADQIDALYREEIDQTKKDYSDLGDRGEHPTPFRHDGR